jgi:hypothetical protein
MLRANYNKHLFRDTQFFELYLWDCYVLTQVGIEQALKLYFRHCDVLDATYTPRARKKMHLCQSMSAPLRSVPLDNPTDGCYVRLAFIS